MENTTIVRDYSFAELVALCSCEKEKIHLAALRLIVLHFKDIGLELFLRVRKFDFCDAQQVIDQIQNLYSIDLNQEKFQARYTPEKIQKVMLESRENMPEDISLLIKISELLREKL